MTTTPGGARWIVLTPSPGDAAWRQALAESAAAAGLRIVDAHHSHSRDVLDDPATIVIAAMPSVAVDAGAMVAAAILPDPQLSIGATGALFDLSMPQSLWVASRILAEACDLKGARIIDAETLVRSQGKVEVVDGLTVCPPPPSRLHISNLSEVAAAEAAALYRRGRPRPGDVSNWSPAIFLYDERGSAGSAEVGAVDITGRPRILVYGPYVALSPGIWRLTVRFSVDDEAARRTFRIDWGTQTDHVSHTVTPGKSGVYETELVYEWLAPVPAEFRIVLVEAAFSGGLTLMGGVLVLCACSEAAPTEAAA